MYRRSQLKGLPAGATASTKQSKLKSSIARSLTQCARQAPPWTPRMPTCAEESWHPVRGVGPSVDSGSHTPRASHPRGGPGQLLCVAVAALTAGGPPSAASHLGLAPGAGLLRTRSARGGGGGDGGSGGCGGLLLLPQLLHRGQVLRATDAKGLARFAKHAVGGWICSRELPPAHGAGQAHPAGGCR